MTHPRPPHPDSVHVIEHPLIAHYLTGIRNQQTPSPRFREWVGQIGAILAYEATRDLALIQTDVQTPMETCVGHQLAQPIHLVPILRAGLGFADSIHRMIPDAKVGHIGMFRDEEHLTPVAYYQKLPDSIANGPVLLVDPMLATGGSAVAAVKLLRSHGCEDIRMVCLIAAPEGISALCASDPALPIYTAAIDRQLNDKGYILPGLGDAGDRLFGTL